MPVSGAWRLSYSMQSWVDSGEENWAHLYINGDQLQGPDHDTSSGNGWVRSTGGRLVTLEASAGDTIEIRTTNMGGYYYYVYFCAEYIPKM